MPNVAEGLAAGGRVAVPEDHGADGETGTGDRTGESDASEGPDDPGTPEGALELGEAIPAPPPAGAGAQPMIRTASMPKARVAGD